MPPKKVNRLKDFAKAIKQACGLNLRDLSVELGYSKTYLTWLFCKRKDHIPFELAYKLSARTGLNLSFFLDEARLAVSDKMPLNTEDSDILKDIDSILKHPQKRQALLDFIGILLKLES